MHIHFISYVVFYMQASLGTGIRIYILAYMILLIYIYIYIYTHMYIYIYIYKYIPHTTLAVKVGVLTFSVK